MTLLQPAPQWRKGLPVILYSFFVTSTARYSKYSIISVNKNMSHFISMMDVTKNPLSMELSWPWPVCFCCFYRCYLLDGKSKGAWLNRSSIIFAGTDKWSGDPRVSILAPVGDKHEYSLQIQKVDVTDDGLYTCSIQSERNMQPKNIQLTVRGKLEYQSHY